MKGEGRGCHMPREDIKTEMDTVREAGEGIKTSKINGVFVIRAGWLGGQSSAAAAAINKTVWQQQQLRKEAASTSNNTLLLTSCNLLKYVKSQIAKWSNTP